MDDKEKLVEEEDLNDDAKTGDKTPEREKRKGSLKLENELKDDKNDVENLILGKKTKLESEGKLQAGDKVTFATTAGGVQSSTKVEPKRKASKRVARSRTLYNGGSKSSSPTKSRSQTVTKMKTGVNMGNQSEKEVKKQMPENKERAEFFKNLKEKKDLEFDYEINNVELKEEGQEDDDLNSKMYFRNEVTKVYRIVNYLNFSDRKKSGPYEIPKKVIKPCCICLKHLVSKKKIRFINEDFDLDMAYITDRVIAMGFPSIGCEKVYRNSITDIMSFFERYHKGNVKIYNLCLEKVRIYNRSLFNRSKVALFPSLDHNPCPVQLILEFCVDICLWLINYKDSVAAIHCKAGKGRTGLMICSYLIFSGLCKNRQDAVDYYGGMRTKNNRGVTIPSQLRYIDYFESFLAANFIKPYINLIPKIIKEYILGSNAKNKKPEDRKIKNLIHDLENDDRYISQINEFRINKIEIFPVPQKFKVNITITDSFGHKFESKSPKAEIIQYEEENYDKPLFRYVYTTGNINYDINTDLKLIFKGGINMYTCVNLWYSSIGVIDERINSKEIKELMAGLDKSTSNISDYRSQNSINTSAFKGKKIKEGDDKKEKLLDEELGEFEICTKSKKGKEGSEKLLGAEPMEIEMADLSDSNAKKHANNSSFSEKIQKENEEREKKEKEKEK
ncbi:MAG: hypothetical protein MJ252_19470, partial [archaeon]|nr:hypothetical protein [archaeon]